MNKEYNRHKLDFISSFKSTYYYNRYNFSSRATRDEVIYSLISINVFFLIVSIMSSYLSPNSEIILYIGIAITLIPSLSLSVRRLHDTGQSGFIAIMAFVFPITTYIVAYAYGFEIISENIYHILMISAYICSIFFIIILAYNLMQRTNPSPNKYGPGTNNENILFN